MVEMLQGGPQSADLGRLTAAPRLTDLGGRNVGVGLGPVDLVDGRRAAEEVAMPVTIARLAGPWRLRRAPGRRPGRSRLLPRAAESFTRPCLRDRPAVAHVDGIVGGVHVDSISVRLPRVG